MEQHVQALCNYERDNWVELSPLAEFAYNNAVLASARMTPFCANYRYDPVMPLQAPKQPCSLKPEMHAPTFAAGLEETDQTLHETLQDDQAHQTK